MNSNDYPMLKIRWLPVGDMTLASSRLRCFSQDIHLREIGIDSSCKNILSGDILILQKRMDFYAFILIIIYSARRKRVVLDIDDVDYLSKHWRNRLTIISKFVGGISVATNKQLCLVKKTIGYNIKDNIKIFDIENPIDYFLDITKIQSLQDQKKIVNGKPIIGWFGNSSAFNLKDEVVALTNLGYKFIIISDSNPISITSSNIIFLPWRYDYFINDLKVQIDLCIFSHSGGENFESKSANKLLTCLAVGIDAFVSDTVQYRKICNQMGRNEFIYTNTEDLISKITKYNKIADFNKINNVLENFTINNYVLKYIEYLNTIDYKEINLINIVQYIFLLINNKLKINN
jgi:hypothetical protein